MLIDGTGSSSPDELDVRLIVSAEDGVGEDILLVLPAKQSTPRCNKLPSKLMSPRQSAVARVES